jgi:hypothetical protein
MTRFFFISIFFLAMISMTSYSASASGNKSSVTKKILKRIKPKENSTSFPVSKTIPKVPAAKTVPPEPEEEKSHSSKTEELPHIHHFHKERMKKIKRHHKKCWALSMILLVICHLAILAMAYMHVAH